MPLEINGETELSIQTDKTLLKSAFSNLFLNSKNAGATVITISLCLTEQSNIEILLSDNGTGIDKKHRAKIWFPFFTTRDDGSGMGLPIVRKIITMLNGEIDQTNFNQQGTHFRILFYSL
jgi:two-component system sensor histidine kinase PilS (NtrC family)